MHTFNELYLENKNVNTILEDNEKIEYNRDKILQLAKNIPNVQIKY